MYLFELAVGFVSVYFVCGVLFATAFVLVGIDHIDPAARGAGVGFQLLVFPGLVILWPLLAVRWTSGRCLPMERNAHRDSARQQSGPGSKAEVQQ